jgi:8-oxo-dGTP diphosphatase
MKEVIVCCAIIREGDRVLIARRSAKMSMPLLWEFPGGKLEQNEKPEDCLIREISEELNILIGNLQFFGDFYHDYPTFRIHLQAFEANLMQGIPSATEHEELRWVHKNQLKDFKFTEADVAIVDLVYQKSI